MNNTIILPEGIDVGAVSDGYHTFNELYDHRTVLFLNLMKAYPDISWKSKKHADGTMFEGGWFIAGINLPSGPITYHLDLKWWDDCTAKELSVAPEWDGHTPHNVVIRLRLFLGLSYSASMYDKGRV